MLDTDVVSRIQRRDLPRRLALELQGLRPCTTFVTVGELFQGAVHHSWGQRRIEELERALRRLVILPSSGVVSRRWGEISGDALRRGRRLPANDAWIAACCLAHELPLATLNPRHFVEVPNLKLVGARDAG